MSKTSPRWTTRVTVKGQVTLPKSVREAAGIRPGDMVSVSASPAGVQVEKAMSEDAAALYLAKLRDMRRQRPLRGLTTDEVMALFRSEV